MPRTANGNAVKQIRAASKAYEALADAFSQLNNLPKLKAQVAAGREIWAEVSDSFEASLDGETAWVFLSDASDFEQASYEPSA